QVDPDLLNKVGKPLPSIDSFDPKVVPGPEEEQQESEALDSFFQAAADGVAASFQLAEVENGKLETCRHDEVPGWAWAVLALAPLAQRRTRRQSRVTVNSISSSSR